MIFGIGTDIVDIRRIEKSLHKNSDKFAARILTAYELTLFTQYHHQSVRLGSAFLAKRFAAKEATAKAFGLGFSDGLSLQHIEVRNTTQGQPLLYFFHRAEQFILDNHIIQSHLSLSDEKHYAIAYVLLECL